MATKTTENVVITSTDGQGKSFVSWDKATSQVVAPIQVTYAGATLSFATATAYRTFLNEVILLTTNLLNSPSGVGAGYASSTAGTPGADSITA